MVKIEVDIRFISSISSWDGTYSLHCSIKQYIQQNMAYEAINVLQTPITQFYYAETIYENECTVHTHKPILLRKNSDV